MIYHVSYHVDIEAVDAEEAAREAHRIALTGQPREYAVTAGKSGTVFIRIDQRGEAKRIA